MKTLIKIITIFILIFGILGVFNANAEVDFSQVQNNGITNHSLQNIASSGDISADIKTIGFSILTTIKYILSGLLVIFLVYIGIQMIMSMGDDEDKLSTSKRQLRYTLMGLIFINIPGTLYQMFQPNKTQIDGTILGTWSSQLSLQKENLFINTFNFNTTLNGGIVMFIETAIFSIAVIMIIISGIQIIVSRGKEEDMSEAKNKIIWSIVGLIFIGFIKSWQAFVYSGQIKDGATLFNTIENLALFLAGPIAIFFLTLAGYYYITSNGDEEKTKKAKSIIINTIIATVIILASHAFLKDLITLTI